MSLANNKALSCSNCGGQLEYNYTQETSKCLYCGSEFKKDKPKREPQDKADQKPRFVEKPATIPEENKVIYDMVFSPRPKFWKAFLWGLGVWAVWLIVSLILAGVIMSATNTNTMPDDLLTSRLFGFYWCLRGIIFCLVWPFLRTRVFYRRY